MPEISRFLGMVIQMYYDDHSEPHIHIRYTDNRCKLDLDGNLICGAYSFTKITYSKKMDSFASR